MSNHRSFSIGTFRFHAFAPEKNEHLSGFVTLSKKNSSFCFTFDNFFPKTELFFVSDFFSIKLFHFVLLSTIFFPKPNFFFVSDFFSIELFRFVLLSTIFFPKPNFFFVSDIFSIELFRFVLLSTIFFPKLKFFFRFSYF
jgi:hypothetical protein